MKVYFDGSHYIGIPHREKPKRKIEDEEIINQVNEMAVVEFDECESESKPFLDEETTLYEPKTDFEQNSAKINSIGSNNNIQSLDELFEELYKKSVGKKRAAQRDYIIKNMRDRFSNIIVAEKYIDEKFEKKIRNVIVRRMRLARKLSLNEFNYFVTFTYDDKKQTRDSFKTRLRKSLSNFASRSNWQYAGVWEGQGENERLHFHGIFNIPEGTMPGELVEKNDYSIRLHRRKKTTTNTFFEKKYGRCDFDLIETPALKGEAMRYLMKYIEKSEEKIVYSRGLARYIVSGIENDDIICSFDEFDSKFILYDNFNCWHEGEFVGQISQDLINKMPKIV